MFARFIVDGRESEDPDANQAGDGQFPPFVIFDQIAQINIPGKYETREKAEEIVVALNEPGYFDAIDFTACTARIEVPEDPVLARTMLANLVFFAQAVEKAENADDSEDNDDNDSLHLAAVMGVSNESVF